MQAVARGLVSKKKKRFVSKEHDIDLDLTYITPRLIAMGFPSVGKEALYRNPLPAVQRFFNVFHPNEKFKVYNLCSERKYQSEDWFRNWAWFPFDDHNPCAFEVAISFCQDMDEWLAKDPDNVAAVHCKAGKGRTGLLISIYLLHSHYHGIKTAGEALRHYAQERTSNNKGVTIPSQVRYVYYYDQYLRRKAQGSPYAELAYKPKTFAIRHVRLVTIPQFDPAIWGGGCDPYMIVNVMVESHGSAAAARAEGQRAVMNAWQTVKLYDQKAVNSQIQKCHPSLKYGDLSVYGETFQGGTHPKLCIRGNVHIILKDMDEIGDDDKMCTFWFNTAFISQPHIILDKKVIDGANKDKKNTLFSRHFKVEVYFEEVPDDWFDPNALEGVAEAAEGAGEAYEPNRVDAEYDTDEEDNVDEAPSSPSRSAANTGAAEQGSATAQDKEPPVLPAGGGYGEGRKSGATRQSFRSLGL